MPKDSSYVPAGAFHAEKKYSSSNTKVVIEDGFVKMYLFGNLIAKKRVGLSNDKIMITNAGWNTNTTRDRLSALGADVYLRGGTGRARSGQRMHLNGEVMENKAWYNIKTGRKITKEADEAIERGSGIFGMIAGAMMAGQIFTKDLKEQNQWKLRMLKAGLPEGALDLPDNWDNLPEEEKMVRLNKIEEMFSEELSK